MTSKEKAEILNRYRELAAKGPATANAGLREKLLNCILRGVLLEIQYADNRGEIAPGDLTRKSKRKVGPTNPSDSYVVGLIRNATAIVGLPELPVKVIREYPGLIELWRARVLTFRALHK